MRKSVADAYLFTKSWTNEESQPKCVVFYCHGIHAHCSDFTELGNYLSSNISAFVFAHDHYGHGRSGGIRVKPPSFQTYVDDVVNHIKDLKIIYKEVPVFLFGFSLGGLIAYHVARLYPELVNGIILEAPALQTIVNINYWKGLFNFMTKMAPNIALPSLQIPSQLTTDPEEQKELNKDTLSYHGGVKLHHGNVITKAIDDAQKSFAKFNQSLLIIFGEKDRVVSIKGAKKLMEKSPSKDKTLIVYPGLKHILHRENRSKRLKIFEDVTNWIVDRI